MWTKRYDSTCTISFFLFGRSKRAYMVDVY